MMFMAPAEMLAFLLVAGAILWGVIALLMLGRTLNVGWTVLSLLAFLPVVVLVFFVTSGVFGYFNGFGAYDDIGIPVLLAAVFLPWPALVTVMVRAARRMQMADGRVVAEVFR